MACFGIKFYELTSSDGITLDFIVYCGRGMFYDNNEHSDMPTPERIPVSLMTPFLNKGNTLFTDNFYTSPSLATFLENDTDLHRTFCTHRQYYSKEIINENLAKKAQLLFIKLTRMGTLLPSNIAA